MQGYIYISGEEKLVYKFNLVSWIYSINLINCFGFFLIFIYFYQFRCSLLSYLEKELNEQGQPECLKLLGNFLSWKPVATSHLHANM